MGLEPKIKAIQKDIMAHSAMGELDRFGENMLRKPMDMEGQKYFFATTRAFFKDVPTGILALALRVNDDWEKYEPFEGTAKAAYVLFADVDEYGLQEQHIKFQPTHHQLFRSLTDHLGITVEDLINPQYALPEGHSLGDRTTEFYRERPIPESLGFHLASETTSSREFTHFLKGYRQYAEHYGVTGENDQVLEFFRIHTLVEPMHQATGRKLIELYHQRDPNTLEGVRAGAMAFQDGFGEMFRVINNAAYGSNQRGGGSGK